MSEILQTASPFAIFLTGALSMALLLFFLIRYDRMRRKAKKAQARQQFAQDVSRTFSVPPHLLGELDKATFEQNADDVATKNSGDWHRLHGVNGPVWVGPPVGEKAAPKEAKIKPGTCEYYMLHYIGEFQPCPLPTPQQLNLFKAFWDYRDDVEFLPLVLDAAEEKEEFPLCAKIRDRIKELENKTA